MDYGQARSMLPGEEMHESSPNIDIQASVQAKPDELE
jgi:hypothetical protein